MGESKTEDQNFLNIIIKEEPLDICEPLLGEIMIKDEPEDSCLAEEHRFTERSCDNTNEEAFSSSSSINSKCLTGPIVTPSSCLKTGNAKISNNQGPVTKKLIINGQEKTCVIVKMPQLNRGTVKSIGMSANSGTPSTPTGKLKVQCPRCKNTIAMDAFRQHIDSCPPRNPRRSVTEKCGDRFDLADNTEGELIQNCREPEKENAGRKVLSKRNEIVQAVYNPSLGKGKVINVVNKVKCTKPNSINTASILEDTWPVELESKNQISSVSTVQKSSNYEPLNDSETKSGRTRSKSFNDVGRESAENDEGNNIVLSDAEKRNHQKLLEVCAGPSAKSNASVESEVPGANSLLLDDNSLSCSLCSFTTDKRRTLQDHERHHRRTNQPILQCVYCNKKYAKHALFEHIHNVHPGQKFQFVHCTPEEPKPASEDNKLTEPKPYVSQKCQFSAECIEDFQDHVKTHTGNQEENLGPSNCTIALKFSCAQCSYRTTKPDYLKVHEATHKKSRILVKCCRCEFRSTIVALRLHERNCSGNPRTEPTNNQTQSIGTEDKLDVRETNVPILTGSAIAIKKKTVECGSQETGKFNNSEESANILDNSLLLKDNTFSCSLCSFTTDKRKTLHDHTRHHRRSNQPILQCFYCNQKYSKHALYKHILKLHPGLKFQYAEEDPKAREGESVIEPMPFNGRTSPVFPNHPETDSKKQASKIAFSFSCAQCSYKCTRRVGMVIHQMGHEKNFAVLQCRRCDFKSTERALRWHELKCLQQVNDRNRTFRYKCRMCSYSCQNKSNLGVHERSHENNVPNLSGPIDNCTCKATRLPMNVKNGNIKTKTKRKTFKCLKCAFSSPSKVKLNRHIKKRHKCSTCNYTANEHTLRRHFLSSGHWLDRKKATIQEEHLGPEYKEIAKDDGKFKEASLLGHSPLVLPTTQDESSLDLETKEVTGVDGCFKKAQFHCSQCSFTTNLRIKLRNHVKMHEENRSLKCRQCSFVTTLARRSDSIRKCRKCGFKSTQVQEPGDTVPKPSSSPTLSSTASIQSELEAHMEKPHENLFKCELCSVVSTQQYAFYKHMLCHQQNQPVIKCSYCNFKSTPSSLKTHVRSHKDQERKAKASQTFSGVLRCNSCSYASGKLESFRKHLVTHEQRQVVRKCPYCRFISTPESLYLHMKGHEQQKNKTVLEGNVRQSSSEKYMCSMCSFTSTKRNNFNRHLMTHKQHQPLIKYHNCSFTSIPRSLARHHSVRKTKYPIKNKGSDVETTKEGPKKLLSTADQSATFQCPICPFTTRLRIQLNVHKRKKHAKSIRTADDNSGSTNSKIGDDILSTLSIRSSPKKKTRGRPKGRRFSCTRCTFTTSFELSWKNHVNAHARNCASPVMSPKKTLLNCPQCSFATYFPAAFTKHRENHHTNVKGVKKIGSIKIFQCEICSFSSYWQYLFKRHVESHGVLNQPINQST